MWRKTRLRAHVMAILPRPSGARAEAGGGGRATMQPCRNAQAAAQARHCGVYGLEGGESPAASAPNFPGRGGSRRRSLADSVHSLSPPPPARCTSGAAPPC